MYPVVRASLQLARFKQRRLLRSLMPMRLSSNTQALQPPRLSSVSLVRAISYRQTARCCHAGLRPTPGASNTEKRGLNEILSRLVTHRTFLLMKEQNCYPSRRPSPPDLCTLHNFRIDVCLLSTLECQECGPPKASLVIWVRSVAAVAYACKAACNR